MIVVAEFRIKKFIIHWQKTFLITLTSGNFQNCPKVISNVGYKLFLIVGLVENYKYSRMIRLDFCNKEGVYNISEVLKLFNIHCTVKKRKGRTIWRISICSKNSLLHFQKHIGFLHSEKREKLHNAINSFLLWTKRTVEKGSVKLWAIDIWH